MLSKRWSETVCVFSAILAVVEGRNVHQKRQSALAVVAADGWQSLGCWSDVVQSRTLSYMAVVGEKVSESSCQTECASLGFIYAGVEYSGECYCDNQLNSIAVQKPASDCSMACAGDSTQACGGADRINIFFSGVPSTNPGVDGWVSQGCYTDSVAKRSLSQRLRTPGGSKSTTIQNCVDTCASAGYILAGAEYAGECWCDNVYNYGGSATDPTTCNMPCKGNVTEFCGGPNRMNLYSLGGATPVAANAPAPPSSAASSATTTASSTTSSASPITTDAPSMTTAAAPPTTTITTDASSTTTAPVPPTTTTTTSADPPASTPTFSAAPTPLSTGLPAGWYYQGCRIDNNNGAGRILPVQQPDSTSLTVESCIATCQSLNYSIAGLEFGNECFCGSSLQNGGGVASTGIANARCHMPCSGNGKESCGGPWFMEVYSPQTLPTQGVS